MLRDNGVWAAALKQPHARLITDGILWIEERGIVAADGVLHEVDIIVLATGFQAADYLTPIRVIGREDEPASVVGWRLSRLLGITMPGFQASS